MGDQQRRAPQLAIVVGADVDEAGDARARGDRHHVVQHARRLRQLQPVQAPLEAHPGPHRPGALGGMVEVEIARADHRVPRHHLGQVAIVVQQPGRDAGEGHVQVEVALEGLLDVGQRGAIGFGQQDVQRDRRRVLGRDALDQGGQAIARPRPLPHRRQADLVDVHHHRVRRLHTGGGMDQQPVQQRAVQPRHRRVLPQAAGDHQHRHQHGQQQEPQPPRGRGFGQGGRELHGRARV